MVSQALLPGIKSIANGGEKKCGITASVQTFVAGFSADTAGDMFAVACAGEIQYYRAHTGSFGK